MLKEIFKGFISLSLIVLIAGCTGMADSMDEFAGLGVIAEEQSTFDGAIIVNVSPTWLTGDPKLIERFKAFINGTIGLAN